MNSFFEIFLQTAVDLAPVFFTGCFGILGTISASVWMLFIAIEKY